MRTESIIERISIKPPIVSMAEKDWARVQNRKPPERKPVRFFRNTVTGDEYLYILGAFALPGITLPGYGIVLGIDRGKHPEYGKRIIRTIEEVEQPAIPELMADLIKLQKKYEAYPVMSRIWYADLDEIQSDRAMDGLKEAGSNLYSFCPASGPFFEKPQPWKGYFEVLRDHVRILDRRQCPKLRNYMAAGPKNLRDVMAFKPENNPALAAIAVGVAVLTEMKPWFWEVDGSAFNLED